MNEFAASPLNSKHVPRSKVSGIPAYAYDHSGDGFGTLLLDTAFADNYTPGEEYRNLEKRYTLKETKEAWNLVRSLLWRAKTFSLKPILIVREDHSAHRAHQFEMMGVPQDYTVIPFEKVLQDAKTLDIRTKALETLCNLYDEYCLKPGRISIEYSTIRYAAPRAMVVTPLPGGKIESGRAYCCDEITAMFTYEYLQAKGYIDSYWTSESPDGWKITAEGFVAITEFRDAKGKPGTVFFVRKYDEELDKFLVPVTNRVAAALNCQIDPVWATPHNGKIDEQIFRRIRSAEVILVDIDPFNFNVGLELGYALALGKPIVTIREKPPQGLDLSKRENQRRVEIPFDIRTLNVQDYERDKAEELERVLTARIGLEFDLRD